MVGPNLLLRNVLQNRSSGGAQVYHQGDGTAPADRLAGTLRYRDIRHHRPRVLFGNPA